MAYQNRPDDVEGRTQVAGAAQGGSLAPMLLAALAQGAGGAAQGGGGFQPLPGSQQPLLTPNYPGPYGGGGNPLPLAPPDAQGNTLVPPSQPQPLITPHGPGDIPQGGTQTGSAASGLQTLAPYISQIVNPGGGRMPGAFPQTGLGTGNPQGGGLVAPPQPQPLITPHNPGDTPQGGAPQGGGLGGILQLLGGLFGGGQGQQGGMGGFGGLLGLLQGVLGGGMGHQGGMGFPGQGQPGQQGFQNNMGPYSQRLAQGLGGNRNFYTPHNNVPQGIPPIMYALMALQQHMRQTQPVMRQQPQAPTQPQGTGGGGQQGSLMDNPGGNPQNNMAHNPAIDRFRARRGLEE